MPKLEMSIALTSITPLSVGAGGSAGSLADKSIVRDGWGRPIIPGSQLKGKLRHAAERLLGSVGLPVPTDFNDTKTDTLIRTIFGTGGGERAPLRFSDLIGIPDGTPEMWPPAKVDARNLSQIRPSVSINRRRGNAEDARLLFQETALAELVYRASPAISGDHKTLTLGHAALLWAALTLTDRWGGGTSRGLGWVCAQATVCWDGQLRDEAELKNALRTLLGEKGAADAL